MWARKRRKWAELRRTRQLAVRRDHADGCRRWLILGGAFVQFPRAKEGAEVKKLRASGGGVGLVARQQRRRRRWRFLLGISQNCVGESGIGRYEAEVVGSVAAVGFVAVAMIEEKSGQRSEKGDEDKSDGDDKSYEFPGDGSTRV